ncbi:hypothetical protein Fot_03809 [Forsythia ovata]|uniref:Uncharacterized protein n=1 Tax=Forsythia ovata TaxID=205694 RepID=A0ABD1XER5_9LAMI
MHVPSNSKTDILAQWTQRRRRKQSVGAKWRENRAQVDSSNSVKEEKGKERIPDVVASEGVKVLQKKRNQRHKKIYLTKTMSTLAEQVQMHVEKNRANHMFARGQAKNEEEIDTEAGDPVASHSHTHSELRNSRHYQPIDPLKERECRPIRSSSVFDRLGDKVDSHQRKAHLFEGWKV